MKLKKMFQHCQWLWMWRGIVVGTNGYYARGWGLNLAWPYFMKTTSLFFLTSDYDCVHVENICMMGVHRNISKQTSCKYVPI
jgi:hypothetical protein